MKRLFYILTVLVLTCTTASAWAAPISDAQKSRITNYLNSLTTMQADFIQIAPDGSNSSGVFSLKRPGKLRWDYDPPVPLLIIVNDPLLIYYDEELGEVTHIPVESTLASFLTREHIALDGDTTITNYTEEKGTIRVTLKQTERMDEGSLTLVFSDKPLTLRKLEITDVTGGSTIVAFNNQKYDISLSNKLFILSNPKTFKKRN